jgi:hypothetical protein
MIRTVWLAMICLAVVSALAAGKTLRKPADSTVAELSADEPTVGMSHSQDTLSKADRLEITYVRHEIQSQPALPAIEPVIPVVTPPDPPTEAKIISRHWRDPNAFSSSSKDSRQTKPTDTNKKSKNVDRKRNQAADRSIPAEPAKPCRPGPFGDLLRSVNLSPACGS